MKKVEVTLINYTHNAVDTLLYTKSTRLEQGKSTREKIENMSPEEKSKELEYMANTIPSSWEFINYVFEIKNVSRAFTHQFVRTRTGSYAQQTMRMLDKKEFTYRIPPRLKETGNEKPLKKYNDCMKGIQKYYDSLIDVDDIAVEDARGILPTNIHTNIIAQFNLRTVSEMARSRTGKRTQDEYREVMDQMINCVTAEHPWVHPFLFPVPRKNFKLLEDAIDDMAIDQSKRYDLHKALDKMRKGDS